MLVVAGPTAGGKSDLAVGLAERLDAEIVGADSRQIYRYMDVGTAKPEAPLRARVRHHLIDVADPDEPYDVARWRSDALASAAEIAARGRRVVVCGGTGLYLRSLSRGLFRGPAADPGLRAAWEERAREDPDAAHAELARVDPASAARLHPNDRVRVVRALEVFSTTGKPLSAWHAEHGLSERPFGVLTLEVVREAADLQARIERRAAAMVACGLVDEVRALRMRFPDAERALAAIGYREAAAVIDGRLDADDLVAAIATATRRYAKRQRTWLRGQTETTAVDADDVDPAFRVAERFFS